MKAIASCRMPRPVTLTPELLHTFTTLVEHKGDASVTATLLGINQPSISKRLGYFQHVGKLIRKPWLERRGKTWYLTEEGQRVLPVVEDLLRRYDHMLAFVKGARMPGLLFACGREAADTFVLAAVRLLHERHPEAVYRVQELRGSQRIEGVASGLLDLALVTHAPTQIAEIARHCPMHIEDLREDPLALACARHTPWTEEFAALTDGRVSAVAMTRFPLILPEPNTGLRKSLDERLRAAGVQAKLPTVLEVGGWNTILNYTNAGLGIGLLPRSIASDRGQDLLLRAPLVSLLPRNMVRLICRKKPGTEELDLTEIASLFRDLLVQTASEGGGRPKGKKEG
jgi:DNA-binding transcriptional LysR family regulator